MAGGGVFDGGVGGVDDDERSGREEMAGLPEQDTRDSVEDILDGDAVVEKRRDEAADECHVGSSGEAVTHDVADDDGESAAIEEESFCTNRRRPRPIGRPAGTTRPVVKPASCGRVPSSRRWSSATSWCSAA